MTDEPLQQKLTAEELESWVPAPQALRDVCRVIDPYAKARDALIRRLMGEQIRSGAEGYIAGKEKGGVVEIGANFWGVVDYSNDVWDTGDLVLHVPGREYDESLSLTYFGVRIEKSGLDRLIRHNEPPSAAPPPPLQFAPSADTAESLSPASTGGRPRAPWWEPLWIEMARQLHMGELVPARLSDIEKAMKNWLAVAHNAHPSERTIREAARKLSWALPNEGNN